MQRSQQQAEKQKKGCEVIALIQANRVQGIPETQQDDDEDGSHCKFGKHTGPGEGISRSRFFFASLFLSGDLAQERTGQQEQSRESRERAVKRSEEHTSELQSRGYLV